MLPRMSKKNGVTAFLQLFVQRNLFDDVRLRRDEDQMDSLLWVLGEKVDEAVGAKRDVVHRANKV